MPPKGKESFIRRQKEIARQQRAQEKRVKRDERRANPKAPGANKGDLSPDELGSLEDIIGPVGAADDVEEGATAEEPTGHGA